MQYDRQAFATAPDGTRLFYGVRGPRPDVLESGSSGPTWILSDGIGCDGFAWRYLQPHLAERHRVVHWHYRAHGRSGLPVDSARIDIAAHARDLLAVMDAAGIESAILAGHSMGTQVSLEAYRLAPDRVRGLPVLGEGPVADYAPLLEDAGFDVAVYRESDDWQDRVTHTYQAVADAKDALIAEMGEAATLALLGEIALTLQVQPYRRRVLVSAARAARGS